MKQAIEKQSLSHPNAQNIQKETHFSNFINFTERKVGSLIQCRTSAHDDFAPYWIYYWGPKFGSAILRDFAIFPATLKIFKIFQIFKNHFQIPGFEGKILAVKCSPELKTLLSKSLTFTP